MIRSVVILVSAFILLMPLSTPAAENMPEEPLKLQDPATVSNSERLTDNLNLSLGLKTWWINQSFQNASNSAFSGLLYGPTILLNYKEKFFSGINYFTGSLKGKDDFEDTEMEKTDLDIWVGFNFHPNLSVYLGYKDIKNKLTNRYDHSYEMTFNGPMIGLDANYPIKDSGFILFGTIEYGYLNWKYADSDIADSTTFGLELGVTYIFPSLPQLSLSGAFKGQNFSVRTDEVDADQESNIGVTLGINFQF